MTPVTAMHQILIDTRAALDNLAIEGCNCAFGGPGYQHEPPPQFLAAEEASSSEVVTAGIAGRILNPRSTDWELKDCCDYSSSLTEWAHSAAKCRFGALFLGVVNHFFNV